ncbi:MAG: glycosyl hydrolase [Terracidiphilus sp.]|nr:glycosyl hydrolase [Terracidiphilus sp.]
MKLEILLACASRRSARCLSFCICITAFLCVDLLCAAETPSHEVSTNSSFTGGLKGWQISGDVRIGASTVRPGQRAVLIGPGPSSIAQRIQIGAENHCMISTLFDRALPASAKLSMRFLGKDGKEWMSLESGKDMFVDKDGKLNLYFRPHPRTASIEIVLSKTASPDAVAASQLKLLVYEDNDSTLKSSQPVYELMHPFWQGNQITQEAVAFVSSHGEPATGTLLFHPTRILSVASYDSSIAYKAGIDYKASGRTLVAVSASIPRIETDKLQKGEIAWNEIGGQQVLVAYEHEDAWTGPIQPYIGTQLPHTMQKLAAREPLEIVAYGDSITFGVGSSHMQKLRPYQAPWIDLFARTLAAVYGDHAFTLDNAAQSGADSNWAKAMAGRMVASLHPDLVIVAFGQNDFWSVSPDKFAENIASVISTVRTANPDAEFLLVPTMRFDPVYSAKPGYWSAVTQYEDRLRALAGPGVQVVDMTAISSAVYAAKAPKDCLNDPLHPNDYLSRWYAQSMVAALVPEFAARAESLPAAAPAPKKGIGDNEKSAPEAVALSGARWYYNWTAHPSAVSKDVEFVPMIWGKADIDGDIEAAKRSGAKNLLTFNEPDGQGESDMTVKEAIALWPRLEASGLRLGSPAATTGAPWLDQFMAAAKARKYRVDFLCLHWYGDITKPGAVSDLQQYLQNYWDRYHLPIWLTEYSGTDFPFHLRKTTVQDNAAFAAATIKMLEKLPFVERYAWYGTRWEPDQENYPTSGLYNTQLHLLTPVGRAYRAAGAGKDDSH